MARDSCSRYDVIGSIHVHHLTAYYPIIGAVPPVDFLPFLKYLPTPLAPWKTVCEDIRRLQRKIYFGLLREAEERVAQGYENGCFMEQVNAPDVY
jgi:hypothetical protein